MEETNRRILVLSREVIAASCEHHTDPINGLCGGQNVELLIQKSLQKLMELWLYVMQLIDDVACYDESSWIVRQSGQRSYWSRRERSVLLS